MKTTKAAKKPAVKRQLSPIRETRKAKTGPIRKDSGVSRSIDSHPDKDKIIQAVIDGESLTAIAKRYGIKEPTLSQYATANLQDACAVALEARKKKDGDKYLAKMDADEKMVRKLLAACDAWLQDPEKEDAYTLDPRAHEIEVIYQDFDDESQRVTKHKELLSAILLRSMSDNETVIEVKMKQADPRELILKTVDSLNKSLELRAKIEQIIHDTTSLTVNMNVQTQWQEIKTVIVQATKGAPDIRQRILEGIEAAGG